MKNPSFFKNRKRAHHVCVCVHQISFLDVPLAQNGHLNCFANVCLFLVWTGAFFARLPIVYFADIVKRLLLICVALGLDVNEKMELASQMSGRAGMPAT